MSWQCPLCLQSERKLRSGSVSSAPVKLNDSQVQSVLSGGQSDENGRDVFDRLFVELSTIKDMQQSIVQDISRIRDSQTQLSADMNARCAQLHDDIVSCNVKLNDHDALLNDHTGAIAGIDSTIAGIGSKLSQFEADLKIVSSSIAAAGNGRSLGPSTASGCADMDTVVAEITEQQRRARNVMVFGVEEDHNANALERKAADLEYVKSLFKFLGCDTSIHGVFRIGAFTANKRRPMKVILNLERDAQAVIQGARKLQGAPEYGSVSLSRDRTPRQLESYRKTRDELQRRIASGERNLKIRYLSGVPTITSSRSLN